MVHYTKFDAISYSSKAEKIEMFLSVFSMNVRVPEKKFFVAKVSNVVYLFC